MAKYYNRDMFGLICKIYSQNYHSLQGLVDSDTLPLNVSREMLQQHSSLKTIKKKLIRKALDMIRKIADEDPDESSDKDKKGTP